MKLKSKRERYDPVRVIHDTTPPEEYEWEPVKRKPTKKEREQFRLMRSAKSKLNWLKHRQERWDKEHAEWLKKRHAEIMAAVEQDKVILAMERAFAQHVKMIRDYYRSEHEKEAEAGDRRRRGELAKILKRINQDTCRLEREELTRRGVVRGRS